MYKLILLTIAMLTTTSSFCQNTYPQKIVIAQDTLVAILPSQLKEINKVIIENTFLEGRVDLMNSTIAIKDSVITNKDLQIGVLLDINDNQVKQLDNCNKAISIQEDFIYQQRKQYNKRTLIYGLGSGLLGIIIGSLIIK